MGAIKDENQIENSNIQFIIWPCSLAIVGFMVLWFLCPGTPQGSTGSGSGFKASQKTGPRFKVSSDRLVNEKPGIKPATPAGLQGIGLSPTPRQL